MEEAARSREERAACINAAAEETAAEPTAVDQEFPQAGGGETPEPGEMADEAQSEVFPLFEQAWSGVDGLSAVDTQALRKRFAAHESMMLNSGDQRRTMRNARAMLEAAPGELKCNKTGHVMFWALTVVPAILNVYSVASRWAARPDRKPEEDWNLSVLTLAWFEAVFVALMLYSSLVSVAKATRCCRTVGDQHKFVDLNRDVNVKKPNPAPREVAECLVSVGHFSMLKVAAGLKRLPEHFFKIAVAVAGDDKFVAIVRDDKKPLINKICISSFVMLQMLVLVGMALCFTLVGLLSVLVKLSQVKFAGAPPHTWDLESYVQFAAFMNNLMGLADPKPHALATFNAVLFDGADGKSDKEELEAKEWFFNMMCVQLQRELGFYGAVVAISQRNAVKMQGALMQDAVLLESKSPRHP